MKLCTFVSYVLENKHYNHVMCLPREIESASDIVAIEDWIVLKQESGEFDPDWDSIL